MSGAGATMTKSQLIEAIVAGGEHPRKVVEVAVNTIFDAMVEALCAGERIEIRGFGNFTVREYKAYTGRNPKTGEQVDVAAKRMPFFKVGKDLRERINDEG
jgi:integration host factor subunit beta